MNPSSSPEERAILLQAKELLEQKRYDEARQRLKPIASHPIAAKWLAKIDELSPPVAAPPPSYHPPNQARPIQPSGKKRDIADLGNFDRADGSQLSPTPPLSWLGCGLAGCGCLFFGNLYIGMALYGILLSFKWNEFGKSKWVLPSCSLVAVVPILMTIFGAILAYALPISNIALSLSIGLSLLVGAAIWAMFSPLGIAYMQYLAYSDWQRHRNSQRLENYGYPLGCVSVVLILLVIPLMALIGLGGYQLTRPQTYETGIFNITTQTGWIGVPPSLTCPATTPDCLAFFMTYDRQNDFTLIMMLNNSANNITTLPAAQAEVEELIRTEPTARIVEIRDTAISGLPAKAIEYEQPDSIGSTQYGMYITFIYRSQMWLIMVISRNQSTFERHREGFRPMLQSLEFK